MTAQPAPAGWTERIHSYCASSDGTSDEYDRRVRTFYIHLLTDLRHSVPEAFEAALTRLLAEPADRPKPRIDGSIHDGPGPWCPYHRPVLDASTGWLCPTCGAEAPPDAAAPGPAGFPFIPAGRTDAEVAADVRRQDGAR